MEIPEGVDSSWSGCNDDHATLPAPRDKLKHDVFRVLVVHHEGEGGAEEGLIHPGQEGPPGHVVVAV